MNIADNYFSRYETFPEYISEYPSNNLSLIIVIPCFSEPDILQTLNSLLACSKPKGDVEILVVVNFSETAEETVKQYNLNSYNEIQEYSNSHSTKSFAIHALYAPNLPKKHAGVGLARKIGMDEAVRRFKKINNEHGIIAAFDSDSFAPQNYLVEVETYFKNNSKVGVATVHYEHPLSGELPAEQYSAIAQYELHLRIYVAALVKMGFPYPYHTVGSSMVVTNKAYCKQGGMNRRQAGEDFYFLQKLFQTEQIGHIGKTMVIPSSRTSHRVPFGTGHAMQTMVASSTNEYLSYNPDSYKVLKIFFDTIPQLYVTKDVDREYELLHITLKEFIPQDKFKPKIMEIRKHSTDVVSFRKRFFAWFNGFMIFRYLNEAHLNYYTKLPIEKAAKIFFREDLNTKQMLFLLRENQKENGF